MIYEITDVTEKIKSLFGGWDETLVYSCLQQVMGKINRGLLSRCKKSHKICDKKRYSI